MRREDLGDLSVFLTVAEQRSFTRAATLLGTSQSAVSQTVRRLEASTGLKLLQRNTRNVAPTEAGEQLLEALRPALQQVDARLAEIARLRDRPSGMVRISAGRHSAETILLPTVTRLLDLYPEITVEISIDSHLTNIIADQFDAGVRLGEQIEKDMIAVPIGPDLRMVVVASPAYLDRHGAPATPHDLTGHRCINIRLPTKGGLYIWEFAKDGREMNVRVEGPLILNDMLMVLSAAMAGVGLAMVMEDQASEHVRSGALVPVLDAWCHPFPGYHLYYPDRRQLSSAFRHFVDAVRYRR